MRKELLNQAKMEAAVTPGTNTGVIIDRLGFLSAIVYLAVGAATGAPTSQSVSLQVQTGEDLAGADMANINNAVIDPLTANNTDGYLNLDLSGCGRYIRVVPTVTFTGGANPAIPINATVCLGDPDVAPVA